MWWYSNNFKSSFRDIYLSIMSETTHCLRFAFKYAKKIVGDGRGNKIRKILSYWRGVMNTHGLSLLSTFMYTFHFL